MEAKVELSESGRQALPVRSALGTGDLPKEIFHKRDINALADGLACARKHAADVAEQRLVNTEVDLLAHLPVECTGQTLKPGIGKLGIEFAPLANMNLVRPFANGGELLSHGFVEIEDGFHGH